MIKKVSRIYKRDTYIYEEGRTESGAKQKVAQPFYRGPRERKT